MTARKGILAAGGVLDRIVEAKALRVDELRCGEKMPELVALPPAESTTLRRSMSEALSRAGRTNIIAEIKRRSPSKGVIREDFNPASIASSYEEAGAAAISVLTEEDFFGGSLEHMRTVREMVSLPVLRKDFIFDANQIYEASAAGADAILLIVAILDDGLLAELIGLSRELKIESLVEVHDESEMERAARAGARLIGVNNRDLTTFAVDLGTSERLAPNAPHDAILVSESGINTGEDVKRLKRAGYDALLVGEHFMRAPDPGGALGRLIADAESL